MLDMDCESNIVNESLPRNIRSFGTLKVISVHVQHDVGVYLMFNLMIFGSYSIFTLDVISIDCNGVVGSWMIWFILSIVSGLYVI